MIKFVNAKINIGLNIVGKREDGYHLLETVFYPVGLYNGTALNPLPFCDIMELTEGINDGREGYVLWPVKFMFEGDTIDCLPEKNLVVRGVSEMLKYAEKKGEKSKLPEMTLRLEKHLPSGAGMGGGSADCVFAMQMIRDVMRELGMQIPSEAEMLDIAGRLGADCPVFVINRPAYAEGIGEKLQPIDKILTGYWLLVLKPDVFISTATAFSGVEIKRPEHNLMELIKLPVAEWRGRIENDFEKSLFPKYPELKRLKEDLYEYGAEYASLTGSGAVVYGLFAGREQAESAFRQIKSHYKSILLL